MKVVDEITISENQAPQQYHTHARARNQEEISKQFFW